MAKRGRMHRLVQRVLDPSQAAWKHKHDEEMRQWKAEDEARRREILASRRGAVLIRVYENLEERLAFPVSRVQCDGAALDRLIQDVSRVVGHGGDCALVAFFDEGEWAAFESPNRLGVKEAVDAREIWLNPEVDSADLRLQIRDVLEGRRGSIDPDAFLSLEG